MRIHVFDAVDGAGLTPWFERDTEYAYVETLAPGVRNPFRVVDQTELPECDAAFIPNNFRHELTPVQHARISSYADAAHAAGKPLFLFSCGDFTDRLKFDPRAYVFRYSTYESYLLPQDIVAPTIARDQGVYGYTTCTKQQVPLVSFCGQAGYKTPRQWVRYYLKTAFQIVRGIFVPEGRARAVGVYWRRRMLQACTKSSLVQTHFIIRHSFSGAQRTIELEPEQAHREFVSSIEDADFVLTPKGDGNYSNRFLETLSLGRIPVLLDTDACLPFEDRIEYGRVMVRVPMNRVNQTPAYIRDWYDQLSPEEWLIRQKEARHAFESTLRFDSFFTTFFKNVLLKLPIDPRERVTMSR